MYVSISRQHLCLHSFLKIIILDFLTQFYFIDINCFLKTQVSEEIEISHVAPKPQSACHWLSNGTHLYLHSRRWLKKEGPTFSVPAQCLLHTMGSGVLYLMQHRTNAHSIHEQTQALERGWVGKLTQDSRTQMMSRASIYILLFPILKLNFHPFCILKFPTFNEISESNHRHICRMQVIYVWY